MRPNNWPLAVGITLLCCSAALSCSYSALIWTPGKSANALYRFVTGGKAGYIDSKGKIVIKPTYRDDGSNLFDDFHNGRMAIADFTGAELTYHYVDMNGRTAIKTKFRSAFPFSEGLASVEIGGNGPFGRGPRGYINISGAFVISPQFDQADDFSEGVATVELKERAGYIEKDGTFAIAPRYLRARSFHEGRAWVIAEGPCRIDPSICGEVVLPPSAFNGHESPETLVCKYGLIDRAGTLLSPLRFIAVGDFSGGLAAVQVEELWGYVDRDGVSVIEPKFNIAGDFSEGLALVAIKSSDAPEYSYGYINRAGAFVITPQFRYSTRFAEGLAVVGDGDSYWYIDHEGQNPFSTKFKAAGNFFNGLAHVKTKSGKPDYRNSGTFAYIDRAGKTVFTYNNQERD
jgi:hypothetical protein